MAEVTAWLARVLTTGSRHRASTVVTLVLSVGIVSALLILIPQVRSFEQSLGLSWLFKLRGPIQAPDEVVMVTISRESAARISLPLDPEKFHRCADFRIGRPTEGYTSLPSLASRWPRCLHALLIDKLARVGANTVAFDVVFRTRPPMPGPGGDLNAAQDQVLGDAMMRARRVLIAGRLESPDPASTGDADEMIEISPYVVDGALGVAPFPVTDRHAGRFDEFKAFTDGGSATPSLPALAIQAFTFDAYPDFRNLLLKLAPENAQLLPASADEIRDLGQMQALCLLIRQLFASSPGLAERMQTMLASAEYAGLDAAIRSRIASLVALHAGLDIRLLNLFGPPGTIREYGYDKVLGLSDEEAVTAFRDKMVFVGSAETRSAEQVDHFPTVFTSEKGVALSGVEIAAMAFANILRDSSIRYAGIPSWMSITLLIGTISTLLFLLLPVRFAIPVVGMLLAGYAWVALYAFARFNVWLPLAIPAGIAAPLGMVTGFSWNYRTARHQRDNLRKAIETFVPKEVVEELQRNVGNMATSRETLECACVATDAAQFTSLAETMRSEDLADYLNRYFDMLFRPVARHGGIVSDIVGDAMLALWPNRSPDTRNRMLSALLEMQQAALQFREQSPSHHLATRFGVEWGRVTLTMVGSQTHLEYRAVGDAVNTASRIQELNKKLGTRCLVSSSASGMAASDYLTRDVGTFVLRGRKASVQLLELVGHRASATREQLDLCRLFAEGIDQVRQGNVAAALLAFHRTSKEFPDDPATAFYVQRFESDNRLVNGALKMD